MILILFLGAPGTGKGSISQKLVQTKGFIHFSTGKIFRALKDKNANSGSLISDDLVNDLVIKELSKFKPDSKVILDGYPRTKVQAEFLNKHYPIKVIFQLSNLTDEYIIERLSNRLLCEKEDHSFNLIHHPPKVPGVCDFDGSKLYKRPDDTGEIIQKRLDLYRQHTQPLIDYYKANSNVIEIDARKSIDQIVKQVSDKLSELE
ncbi:adenylate kinase family protein [Candidatus Mycoplasma haematohominis]|uniref:adenylate kinase family protein n=1 Tax=Candidatus Mycoplasma haematohominis TaxID=1494318 RepID=UPI001C0A77EB|nr:nucleoside monophosphate kinase [Candidatus Mycoplasma haemohominis]